MKNLLESLNKVLCDKAILEEYTILEAEEILQLNESFNSDILKSLAKAINQAETNHREHDKQSQKNWKDRGYSGSAPKSAKSFTTIFGPINDNGKKLQGLKWDQIKDDDFKLYNSDDKELEKLLKSVYQKKQQANFICCEPNTKDVILFIKGYGGEVKVYGFKTNYGTDAVSEKTAPKYKYGERALKFDETMMVIKGLDVYALIITDDMKKEYYDLSNERKEAKKGMINYDQESLNKMLKDQKARYNALVKKMKADKMNSDKSQVLEKLEKTHQECVKIMQEIISNFEKNGDQYFDVSRLLSYSSYAYQSFYDSLRYAEQSKRGREKAKQRYAEKGREWNDEEYDKYDFDKHSSDQEMNKVDEYIKETEKMIADMRKRLNN